MRSRWTTAGLFKTALFALDVIQSLPTHDTVAATATVSALCSRIAVTMRLFGLHRGWHRARPVKGVGHWPAFVVVQTLLNRHLLTSIDGT